MIVAKSQYSLDSNPWAKSVSDKTINLSKIAAGLNIITMTGKCKVPYFLKSYYIGSCTGQYLPPCIFIQMRHLVEIRCYNM